MENDRTTVEAVPDICKNIETSERQNSINDANDKSTSTENDFKMEPKEETINDECKSIISFILNLVMTRNMGGRYPCMKHYFSIYYSSSRVTRR